MAGSDGQAASPKTSHTPDAPDRFAIVAVGASAGGVETLMRLFSLMPVQTSSAFVVVVHLSPKRASHLAELIQGVTAMPVRQVQDGDQVESGHIYVIPPNHFLGIEGGRLRLVGLAPRPTVPRPIDYFMRSLAADQPTRAVGIVLTGADHDGTVGLKEIKAAGGFTIAQDPDTAVHDGMPRSALAAQPDLVLRIEAMPDALADLAGHTPAMADEAVTDTDQQGADALRDILDVVLAKTGYDFHWYRPKMLRRRLWRRMGLQRLEDEAAYLDVLEESNEEARELARDFRIGVTEFYRDPEAWQELEARVLPALLTGRDPRGPLRVWSVGCATGEEAYSVAMSLLELLAAQAPHRQLQVFASDIDAEALKIARAGCYASHVEATVPPHRLQRYFRKADEQYEVRKELRDAVVFAHQNILSDPPFSRLDLIICRNLLIYLEAPLQQKILELFHFALKPGGFLFLGKSETLGMLGHLFEPDSRTWRIFHSVGARTRLARALPANRHEQGAQSSLQATPTERQPGAPAEILRRLLLEGHAPAAALIDRNYRVLYLHGPTDRYLTPPKGEPNWDLPSLARRGLRIKLRAALHRAIAEEIPVSVESVMKRQESPESSLVDILIRVEPVDDFRKSGLLLVTFRDRPATVRAAEPGEGRLLDESGAMQQLEQELSLTRRELQGAVEDLETANAELRVINEEAMSMSEELQSSNEELETAKEELQSINEELTTVNTQLEEKVDQLEHANNDLANFLSSTNIATLFLDRDLHIKRFTPATSRLFRLIPTDLGRPLSDIASGVEDAELLDAARRVLRELTPDERAVRTPSGEWFLRRILPYRTGDGHIDGVVVTFTDISTLRRAAENERLLATVVRDSNDAVIVFDFEGRIISWNRGAEALYGYSEAEALTMNRRTLVAEMHRADERVLEERVRAGTISSFESKRVTRSGSVLDVSLTMSSVRDDTGNRIAIVSTERDITERQQREREKRISASRFRSLAESVPALIWTHDEQRRSEYLNRSFEAYSGVPLQMLTSEGWERLLHPDDRELYAARYDEAFAHRDRFEMDLRLRQAGGGYRWMRTVGVPRYDDQSTFLGYVGLLVDVHDRRLAEESLAEADKRKDEFLAMLGHELRNPLSPIRTAAELLITDAADNSRVQWAAGVIRRQAHHLNRLVEDLVDLARISSGKIELKRQPVDLAEVVGLARETTLPLIEGRHQTLTVQLPSQPRYVDADRLRLTQVVSNLLRNASKFTEEGGAITVSVEHRDGQAVLSVRDTGVGIAPDMLDRIFELFTQAPRTLDRAGGGLGLGLSLVRRLVTLHGGRVEARSEGLGKGSEFLVWLPALPTSQAVPEPATPESESPNRAMRVLVVDDNHDAADTITVMLTAHGHEVQTLYDGATATAEAIRFRPNAAILDIGLPGVSGYDLARQLRSNRTTAGITLISLTGYGQPGDVERSRSAGFDHHLVKPVEPQRLLAVLASAPHAP